jgi:hypothetical protein
VPVEHAIPAVAIEVVEVTLWDTLTVYTPVLPALWNVRVCGVVAVCPPTLIVPVHVPVHGFVESADTVEATQPEPDPKISDMPLKNAALPAVTVSVAPLMVPITVRVPRAAIAVPAATPEPWMASPAARAPVGVLVTVRVVPTMMPLNTATPVPAGQ